jgi:hypothetical protein
VRVKITGHAFVYWELKLQDKLLCTETYITDHAFVYWDINYRTCFCILRHKLQDMLLYTET